MLDLAVREDQRRALSVQPRPEHTMAADGTFLTTPMVALAEAPPPT